MIGFSGSDHFLVQSTRLATAILSRTAPRHPTPAHLSRSKIIHQITQGPFFIHALISPVTSLLITIDLCATTLDQTQNVKRVQTLLHQARHETEYLYQIIQASRQATRSHRGSFKLKTSLQEVVTRLHQPWLGNSLLAHLAISDQLSLKGQAFFLQEAVSCLIKNAFEAYGSKRYRTVLLSCYQHGSSVVVQVSDHGSGMDWKETQLAFQKQVSSKGQHHGYGLQFVQHVSSDIYRGKLHVHSLKEVGTVVTFIIPL